MKNADADTSVTTNLAATFRQQKNKNAKIKALKWLTVSPHQTFDVEVILCLM